MTDDKPSQATKLDAEALARASGGAYVFGRPGADSLQAGDAGGDFVFGEGGDDTLTGGAGGEHLFGGAGHDSIDGGAGRDSLHGDAGDDTVVGGGDADYIDGQAGNDLLDGGLGDGAADSLYGAAGDDTFVWAPGSGSDLIAGMDGRNTLALQGMTADDLRAALTLSSWGATLVENPDGSFGFQGQDGQPITEAFGTLTVGNETVTFYSLARITLG